MILQLDSQDDKLLTLLTIELANLSQSCLFELLSLIESIELLPSQLLLLYLDIIDSLDERVLLNEPRSNDCISFFSSLSIRKRLFMLSTYRPI